MTTKGTTTLNGLVRDQILAEGPEMPYAATLNEHDGNCEDYVSEVLDNMTNTELLERISSALETLAARESRRTNT
jgi:hypothetical protein